MSLYTVNFRTDVSFALLDIEADTPSAALTAAHLALERVSGGAKVGQWSGGAVLPRGGVITGHWLG